MNNVHQEDDFIFGDVDVPDMSGLLRKLLVLDRFFYQQDRGLRIMLSRALAACVWRILRTGIWGRFIALYPRFTWDWLVLDFSGRSGLLHFWCSLGSHPGPSAVPDFAAAFLSPPIPYSPVDLELVAWTCYSWTLPGPMNVSQSAVA